MRAGVQFFPSSESISPVEFAGAAEERGFESVFFPDHTHVPVGGDSGWPSGADVPEYYRTVMDPLVVLGAVAAATKHVRIGTAVCLVAQRDPIILAKQIATIDRLSGGRVLFGVGAGWNEEEMHNHGTNPSRRFTLLRERIEAMSAIWTEDEAAYRGELVRFAPLWSWPKPVQRPRPPVLLGGSGARVLKRVVAYADGWIPFREGTDQVTDRVSGHVEDFESDFARRIRELQELAAAHGRDRVPVTLFNPCPHRAALARYEAMGVERVVFWLPTTDNITTLRALDSLAELVS
ncbi:LLM class F420-dependent oxidoreductase [Saccharopolyspora sp. NPDC000995]